MEDNEFSIISEGLNADSNTDKGQFFNPFPGLRPFRFEESHLYFGREEQIGEVLDKLIENQFVAIIGTSGIGKSSFINCGILPILFKDYKTGVSSKWEVFNFRPGNSPIYNMAKSLTKDIAATEVIEEGAKSSALQTTHELLKQRISGLVSVAEEKHKVSNKNILIYIDQFEEVFRYRDKHSTEIDEVNTFLNLLISAINQSKVPIYIIITMRSDFVGECARYPEFTDKINDSQFLIPQMTREERRKAIIGPVETVDATIDEELVNKILTDVGEEADALPVMQHAMMRTYDYWARNSFSNDVIGFSQYEAIGGMEKALSVHANEAFYELSESQQVLCEKIFKTITEKGDGGRGTRRPTRLIDIATITGADIEEVQAIVEHFRAPGRTLLMPPYTVAIDEESMIDISHESLMRIWTNLREWVDDEFESAKLYLRLCEAAEMHQLGKAGLWRPPDLQIALSWLESHKPSLTWGLRYNPGYERAIMFLDYSKKEYEKEQINKQKIQKRRLFIAKLISALAGIGLLIMFGFYLYGLKQGIVAKEEAAKAEIARKEAVQSAEEALLSKEEAERERHNAEIAAEEAEESARIARNQKLLAEIAKDSAEAARRDAIASQEIAVQEKEKADKLRMLSISRSMAIKSLQMTDSTRQGLVAQQAYIFNKRSDGNDLDPDIYNGLYYALKTLKGDEHNKLNGHKDNVRVIVKGPGNKIYTTGSDGQILSWNLNAPDIAATNISPSEEGKIHKSMAISPNKRWLAVGGDYGYIQVFDLTEANPKPTLLQGSAISSVWHLSFGTDNTKLISVGQQKRILQWDVAQGANGAPKEIAKSNMKINAIAVSPNGNKIAAAQNDGLVTLYDAFSGAQLAAYQSLSRIGFPSVTFSPDGKSIAAGDEQGLVYYWRDVNFTDTPIIFRGHKAWVNNLRFSSDGNMLASGSWDRSIRIWNPKNPSSQPVIMSDHKDWVVAMEFSPDGKYLISGCKDNIIRLWPTNIEMMAQEICPLLSERGREKMTSTEWYDYVAKQGVLYENTCDEYQRLNQ